MKIVLWSVVALAACKGKSSQSDMKKPEGECNVDGDCVTKCDAKDACRCVAGKCTPRDATGSGAPAGSSTSVPSGSSAPAGSSTSAPSGSSAPAGSSTSVPSGSSASTPPAAPVPPFTVDMSPFDRSCKTKADCRIVKADPCNKCSCGAVPIARTEAMKFEKALGEIDCKKAPKDDRRCGECRGNLPDCVDGKCIAVPEK